MTSVFPSASLTECFLPACPRHPITPILWQDGAITAKVMSSYFKSVYTPWFENTQLLINVFCRKIEEKDKDRNKVTQLGAILRRASNSAKTKREENFGPAAEKVGSRLSWMESSNSSGNVCVLGGSWCCKCFLKRKGEILQLTVKLTGS